MTARDVHPDGTPKSAGNAFDPRAELPHAPVWPTTAKPGPKPHRGKEFSIVGAAPIEQATLTLDRNGKRTVKLNKNVHTTSLAGSRA